MRNNDLVKKIARLRSAKHRELERIVRMDGDNHFKIGEMLFREICAENKLRAIKCYNAIEGGQLIYFYLRERGYENDFLVSARPYELVRIFIEDRINTVDYLVAMENTCGRTISAIECRDNKFTYLFLHPNLRCAVGENIEGLYDTVADLYGIECREHIHTVGMTPFDVFLSFLHSDRIKIIKGNRSVANPTIANVLSTIR